MPTTLEEAICIIEQVQAKNAALQAENAALKQQLADLAAGMVPPHHRCAGVTALRPHPQPGTDRTGLSRARRTALPRPHTAPVKEA
jgi:hypothetical protein